MVHGLIALFALSGTACALRLCRSDEQIRERWREYADDEHAVLLERISTLLSLATSVVFLIGCWRLL